jgi:hypothetical protein
MNLQRGLLRVMLISLAVAALLGVAAVLFQVLDAAERAIATAIAVAITSALLFPASRWADRQRTRPAGLLAMTVIIVGFVLSLALIWELDHFIGGRGFDDLFEMLAWWLLTGAAAVAALFLVTTPHARAAGWLAVSCAAVTFLLLMIATWLFPFFTYSRTGDNFYETAGLLAGFGALSALCLIGLSRPMHRPWRWLGVAAATAGFIVGLIGVWFEPTGGQAVFVCLLTTAIFIAHANLLILVPLKPSQLWLRYATMAAALGTVILIDALVISDIDLDFDLMLTRIMAALLILAACGSLALVVLTRLNRGVDLEEATGSFTHIALQCPRCHKKQSLPLGDAQCTDCGLRITTRIEEPRCPQCGYLLYMLKSSNCPECGHAVAKNPPADSSTPV